MNLYQAIAEQIDRSCCNCSSFELDQTMLSGRCILSEKKKSAIGTCNQFSKKKIALSFFNQKPTISE